MSRAPVIGILTNDPNEVFQRDVIAGVEDVARGSGLRTRVAGAPHGVQGSAAFPFDPDALAGLLVIANVAADAVLLDVAATGIPISLVSHRVPRASIPAVIPDNRDGMRQLIAHVVVDCGRQRLAFLRGRMDQYDGLSRDAAFRQELVRHDLSPAEVVFLQGDFEPDVAAESTRALRASGTPVDAIVAADYRMAIAARRALEDLGVDVPGEVVVAGFGDSPDAAAAGITTVDADIVELGRRACRQLVGQINGLPIHGLTVLNTRLVPRSSTAPLP